MKLFLLSNNLTEKTSDELKNFLGDKNAKALFVTTAAVPYGLEDKPEWLTRSIDEISPFVDSYDEISLEEDTHIPKSLGEYDFVFVLGGNSFYLAYRLNETGFGATLKNYIKNDGLYLGSSAGSLILMDDISEFAIADDPSKAPEIHSGLNLIEEAIIPHVDNDRYKDIMATIKNNYSKKQLEVVSLNDDQAFLVDGNLKKII